MNMFKISRPWTVKHKPLSIEEIQIESKFKNKFINIVTQKYIPNMIICGPPGSGKTSIGKLSYYFIYF